MKTNTFFISLVLAAVFHLNLSAQKPDLNIPIVDETRITEEKDGMLVIEAEHFYKQRKSEIRQWYRTDKKNVANVGRDEDKQHAAGASNGSYIEILPDTRVTHADTLIRGENFSNEPGKMAIVHYKVKINTPGRYYVWVRAFSTGGEDNGVHVGFNGQWPEHGQRIQWCKGKNQWTWSNSQRTKEVHCGVPQEIYLDFPEKGIHDIQFSMREDGFEFDKFILTRDSTYIPKGEVKIATATLPEESYFQTISSSLLENKTLPVFDFPIEETGFYRDAGGKWLAIKPDKHKEALTTTSFNFKSDTYDIVFVAVGENDGQSRFTLIINEKELGSFTPPLSTEMFEEGSNFNKLWKNISLKKGDKISVKAKIGSADGKEWARARWSGLVFTPIGKGSMVSQTSPVALSEVKASVAPVIKPPLGRIAIVADGNSPDPDDLGGTAVSIALLRAAGLENRLVHYSHSCDLKRVERISEAAEKERHALMQSACDVTARRWGGFESLTFYDAKWRQKETVNDLVKAINASTAHDPLWIIEAGEPDIIGYALDASKKTKHNYVKVVTHHPANDDAGDYYTWQQILDFGVEEVRIPDQNIKLKVPIDQWNWAREHPDSRIQWIWLQGKIAEVDDVVKFQKGKWDCSDAGMVLYWITGATNGGLEQGTVDHVKKILLDYVSQN